MDSFIIIATFTVTMLLAWKITGWVYQYALSNAILDYPNQRSLHTQPTPRGGGLSIAISVLAGMVSLWLTKQLPGEFVIAALPGACLIAVTGWMDDKFGFPAQARAGIYLLAAVWGTYWIMDGTMPSATINPVLFGTAMIAIAWLTNLYNFMDGSDGIAAIQAICAGTLGSLFLFEANEGGLALLVWVVVASSAGFLIWNWPPARIFMGDVGSCLLGYIYGLIIFETFARGTLSLPVWLILLSLFISDASLTLLLRMFAGEKWWHAHRQHAYQRYIQMGNSHKKMNYHFLFITILVIYPFATIAFLFEQYQWYITGLLYALTAGIWLIIQIKYKKFIIHVS